ncbi:hypothetical protein [Cellulomonas sp. HZM]|uniref:hypothetical protein n=1 Tax=Cellulomonas sp. HZM TaxID=1454010 RepID=UPI000492FCE8|nr:hypothetical protein [Cellulomonas sp. HZM]
MSMPTDDSTGTSGLVTAAVGRDRRSVRRGVVVAVAAAVVVVAAIVVAIVVLGGDHSRPAPPMTDAAKAAGAVRLTYPNRALPPPVVSIPVEGRDPVEVEFGDVEPGADGAPVASFALREAGDEWHRVELPAGGQADVLDVRVRVLAVHDGGSAKDDAVDVVLEPQP